MEHFLFRCPQHYNERNRWFRKLYTGCPRVCGSGVRNPAALLFGRFRDTKWYTTAHQLQLWLGLCLFVSDTKRFPSLLPTRKRE